MMQTTFTIQTNGQGLYEFTDQVVSWVRGAGVLTLFIQHTSASILVQENADPEVWLALGTWQGIYLFEHRDAPHHRRVIATLS